MTYGKPLFAEHPDSGGDEEDDFSSLPGEASYQVLPNNVRRQLTPRDVDQNRQAKTLFDHIVPGLPIDADPPEMRRAVEPFSAIIEKTLKKLKIDASPWLDELTAAWPALVSPEVAKVTRPGKWDNSILYIYVTTSVKLFEIRRTQLKNIEQAVRAFAPDIRIRQIRLMVNAVPLPFN